MARRTALYRQVPWTGGLNDTVDPGLLPANDLVAAENMLFSTSGARIKREGHSYLDAASLVPSTTFRESTGTTRTLTFSSNLSVTANDFLVVGESIRVSGGPAAYNGDFVITGVSTNTITYTASPSLSESSTADTAIVVTRIDRILALHDLWYYNPSSKVKEQQILAVSNVVESSSPSIKFFRYDINGNRKAITPIGADTFGDSDVDTTDDEITLTAHEYTTGYRVILSNTGGALPGGLSGAPTEYYVIVLDANTIQLAASLTDALLGDPVDITSNAGGGTHTITPQGFDAWGSAAITRAQVMTVNNKAVISFDTVGVLPRYYNPITGKFALLSGDAPDFFTMSYHFQRLVVNDKTNKDRVHYSAPGNPEQWQGIGDSGAIDIGTGDGDPEGITTIFPSFKGRLFVGKRNRTYQLFGDSPENFQIVETSKGLGTVGPQAVAQVDLDDVLYWSDKGIHSLAATDSYGDFQGAFVSAKIQNRFNAYAQGRLKFTQGIYIGQLNSVAWLVSDANRTDFSSILLLNTQNKEWYTWPDISATALALVVKGDASKLFYAKDGRIVETQNGTFADFDDQPIRFYIKTGTIYPQQSPDAVSGFKKFTLMYKPRGAFEATARVKIDNFGSQPLSFTQSADGALLGVDFILGQDVLAFENVLAPFTLPIDGFGRGATIEIEQSGTDEQLEIYGFGFEIESSDIEQETKQIGVND